MTISKNNVSLCISYQAAKELRRDLQFAKSRRKFPSRYADSNLEKVNKSINRAENKKAALKRTA